MPIQKLFQIEGDYELLFSSQNIIASQQFPLEGEIYLYEHLIVSLVKYPETYTFPFGSHATPLPLSEAIPPEFLAHNQPGIWAKELDEILSKRIVVRSTFFFILIFL